MLSSLVCAYLPLNPFWIHISVYQHHLFESTVFHWGANSAVTVWITLSVITACKHKFNNCCFLFIWQLDTFMKSIFMWMHILSLSEYQVGNWLVSFIHEGPWVLLLSPLWSVPSHTYIPRIHLFFVACQNHYPFCSLMKFYNFFFIFTLYFYL